MFSNFSRQKIIIIFSLLFMLAFHYESIRYSFLEPWLNERLPKIKFLFPPAGWIMFYEVDETYGYSEVYGVKGKNFHKIDPHEILRTHFVGFDNVKRNALSQVLNPAYKGEFCRSLKRKFSDYDNFLVATVYYPDIVKTPDKHLQWIEYSCDDPVKGL